MGHRGLLLGRKDHNFDSSVKRHLLSSGQRSPSNGVATLVPHSWKKAKEPQVDAADAPSIKIPYLMLPSKDEDADAVKEFQSKLTVPHEVVTFSDQIHVRLSWYGVWDATSLSLL